MRKKLDFFVPGGESASKSIASARFRTPRGASKKLPFFTGTLFETLRAIPGRSRGASETLWIVPGSSLGALVTPKTLPGPFLGRFWEPRRPPRIDFASKPPFQSQLGVQEPLKPPFQADLRPTFRTKHLTMPATALETGIPKRTPFQGQPDVQGPSKLPFQAQLGV